MKPKTNFKEVLVWPVQGSSLATRNVWQFISRALCHVLKETPICQVAILKRGDSFGRQVHQARWKDGARESGRRYGKLSRLQGDLSEEDLLNQEWKLNICRGSKEIIRCKAVQGAKKNGKPLVTFGDLWCLIYLSFCSPIGQALWIEGSLGELSTSGGSTTQTSATRNIRKKTVPFFADLFKPCFTCFRNPTMWGGPCRWSWAEDL